MLEIVNVSPAVGVPGGSVVVNCRGFDASDFARCRVFFGAAPGRIVSASPTRVIAAIPESVSSEDARAGVRLICGGRESAAAPFAVAELLAEDMHPVANPAYDPETGAIFTTVSGSRGKKVEVPVWRISSAGAPSPFLTEGIVNPTGLAFDGNGALFITSRNEGVVYRVSSFKEVEPFARNLGVATGVAFDRNGALFVGDRQGTIFRVDGLGEAKKFAELEPSVAAYHLAFGPDGALYVTAPTTAGTRESVHRVTRDGRVSPFFTGLGRPQGLALDVEGNVYVCASLNGVRGVVKIAADGRDAEIFIAGNRCVGIAFDERGRAILATNHEIYRVPADVAAYMAVW